MNADLEKKSEEIKIVKKSVETIEKFKTCRHSRYPILHCDIFDFVLLHNCLTCDSYMRKK